MDDVIHACKAFADPTRLRILAALRAGELCVCELCDALGVTQSTLSTHLQVIRDSGLVCTRREGKWIYYTLQTSGLRLVEKLFHHFSGPVGRDKRIQADANRLKRRLARRENGACCRGFARVSVQSLVHVVGRVPSRGAPKP